MAYEEIKDAQAAKRGAGTTTTAEASPVVASVAPPAQKGQQAYDTPELNRQAEQSLLVRQNAPKWKKDVDVWEQQAIDNGVLPLVDPSKYGSDPEHTWKVDEFKKRGVATRGWEHDPKTMQFRSLMK